MNKEALTMVNDFILLFGAELHRIETRLQTIEDTNIWYHPEKLVEVIEEKIQLDNAKNSISAVLGLLFSFKEYIETGKLPSVYVENLEKIQKLKERKNNA